ncbi:hypothetical protein Cpir12675_006816 [Ceratocystis pirilliformis]|uniref:U-box domain-containing protein n=1 Tax=Ceratocystis pirilliformis TaxID=259994 RepID=A0ABR3YF77_9PEZI
MNRDQDLALELKNKGNIHFVNGDFTAAEGLYSKAIVADPYNPFLYNNRGIARLKLQCYDACIEDCLKSLELSPDSLKPTYYISQAQLELGNVKEALETAKKAHELCIKSKEYKSLAAITQHVLRCKKDHWDQLEKRRIREDSQLEKEALALMLESKQKDLEGIENESDRREIESEWETKMNRLQAIFETSRAKSEQKRTVPDWVIDDISFGIMVDPVITKSGKSYERASILEHLKHQQIDPLTRESLLLEDLRPNLDLRAACEEFLDNNGWAVDW